MAFLIRMPQPERVGLLSPKAVYSRVVSCKAFIKSPAHRAFGITEPLGGQLWLNSVRVWFAPHLWSSSDSVTFYILHGRGVPADAAAILNWEDILPIMFWGKPKAAWEAWADFHPFVWTMTRLFIGEAHRFGIWVDVGGAVPVLSMMASFEISEG